MRIGPASKLSPAGLALIDEVSASGETIIVTKNGKPMANLVPHRAQKRSPLGIWKGKMEITGDIISPLDVEWEALK